MLYNQVAQTWWPVEPPKFRNVSGVRQKRVKQWCQVKNEECLVRFQKDQLRPASKRALRTDSRNENPERRNICPAATADETASHKKAFHLRDGQKQNQVTRDDNLSILRAFVVAGGHICVCGSMSVLIFSLMKKLQDEIN